MRYIAKFCVFTTNSYIVFHIFNPVGIALTAFFLFVVLFKELYVTVTNIVKCDVYTILQTKSADRKVFTEENQQL